MGRPKTLSRRLAGAALLPVLFVGVFTATRAVIPQRTVFDVRSGTAPQPLTAAERAEQDRRWFAWQEQLGREALTAALRRHRGCRVTARPGVIPAGFLVRRTVGDSPHTARPRIRFEPFDRWMARTPADGARDPAWGVAFCYSEAAR